MAWRDEYPKRQPEQPYNPYKNWPLSALNRVHEENAIRQQRLYSYYRVLGQINHSIGEEKYNRENPLT